MSQKPYRTIDPLILQTLNLNEKRMNHILNILHGKEEKKQSRFQKKIHDFTLPHRIKHINNQQQTLPTIATHRRDTKKSQERDIPLTYRRLDRKKSTEFMTKSRSNSPTMSIPSQQMRILKKQRDFNIINEGPTSRNISVRQSRHRLQTNTNKKQKKVQILKDYMLRKLKRSKSQQINAKDVYRVEIELLVSEATDIQNLQQAQKKMQRLKKRCKHLQRFDKQYFSKLNQHDLFVLG